MCCSSVAAPSEPRQISVDQLDNLSLNITWNKPTDTGNPHFCHYEVEIDGNSIFLNSSVHNYTIPSQTFLRGIKTISLWAITCANGVELESLETQLTFGESTTALCVQKIEHFHMYLGNGMNIHMRKYGSLGLYCSSFNGIQEFEQRDKITSQQGSNISMQTMCCKFMSFVYV